VHGQRVRWILPFLMGNYGVPIAIAKRVIRAGYALNGDPQVRQMGGKPFIHGLAVAAGVRRQGVATELVHRVLEKHRSQGARFCFAVIRPGNTPVIALLTKVGFRVSHLTQNRSR
jgi:ribosomal protein S18 acetylase RimI-like enzyme